MILFSACVVVDILSSHFVISKQLKIFIATIPTYATSEPPMTGSQLLGTQQVGDVISAEHSMFASGWNHVDRWWIHQMAVSPLVTSDIQNADIVFVPFAYHHWETHNFNYLLGNSTVLFPYLTEKPHLIVVSHPLKVHKSPVSAALLDISKKFHYITLNGDNYWGGDSPSDYQLNITISPHFWRQHWHAGMSRYHMGVQHYDQTIDGKMYLATGSWLQRKGGSAEGQLYYSRVVWRDACRDAGESVCTFVEWQETKSLNYQSLVLNVRAAIEESWYTLVPWGDFGTRGSVYDALLSSSIPILEEGMRSHLPYTDMLNYTLFVVFTPRGNKSILKELNSTFSHRRALQMLMQKERIQHVFQYSLYPDHSLVRFEDRHVVSNFDDAFTFTLKTFMRQACQSGVFSRAQCHNSRQQQKQQ